MKPSRRSPGSRRANPATPPAELGSDRAALLLMLSFIEAECLRLGATEAAGHAALAAKLMTAATAAQPRMH